MQEVLARLKRYFADKQFSILVLQSVVLFVFSMVVHYTAGVFATEKASNAVTDLLLGRLPVVDTSVIFIEGNILFWVLIIVLSILEPKRIPFVLKSLSVFMLTRAFFVTMTHLGTDPRQIVLPVNSILDKFTFGGDLFFSGHTGAPFLMALVFWRHPYLRWIFLTASVIFGASVLLGHQHYSIDVFAAFFIAYGIYHIALKLFEEDHQLFLQGLEN